MKPFQEEILRMLSYVFENNIKIEESDIYRIKEEMSRGIILKNDARKELFFSNMTIETPKSIQMQMQTLITNSASQADAIPMVTEKLKKLFSQ